MFFFYFLTKLYKFEFSFSILHIIFYTMDQIPDIEEEISSMLNSLCLVITTITGIGIY